MSKASLKLKGTRRSWAAEVRDGALHLPDGSMEAVAVRVTRQEATAEALLRGRAALALFGTEAVEPRLTTEPSLRRLLPLRMVTAVNGRVAEVYPAFDGVALARVAELMRARAQAVPARVAVEVAAHVAAALAVVYATTHAPWQGAHPGCVPELVLLSARGEVRLAGATAVAPQLPLGGVVGYTAPEGAVDPVYMAAALLAELLVGEAPPQSGLNPAAHELAVRRVFIRALSRPGDIPPEAVGRLLQRGLAWDPAARGPVSAFAHELQELARRAVGPTLAEWAAAPVQACTAALPAGGLASAPGGSGISVETSAPPAPRPAPAADTYAGVDSKPPAPVASPTFGPDTNAGRTLGVVPDEQTEDAPPLEPPARVEPPPAPRPGPPPFEPAAEAPRAVKVQPEVSSPRGPLVAGRAPTPPGSLGPGVLPGAGPGLRAGPSLGAPAPAAPARGAAPAPRPPAPGPISPAASAAPAGIAPAGLAPSGLAPGGEGLGAEEPERISAGRGLTIAALGVLGVFGLVALAAVGWMLFSGRGGTEVVEAPPPGAEPAPVEPAAVEPAPAAPPGELDPVAALTAPTEPAAPPPAPATPPSSPEPPSPRAGGTTSTAAPAGATRSTPAGSGGSTADAEARRRAALAAIGADTPPPPTPPTPASSRPRPPRPPPPPRRPPRPSRPGPSGSASPRGTRASPPWTSAAPNARPRAGARCPSTGCPRGRCAR